MRDLRWIRFVLPGSLLVSIGLGWAGCGERPGRAVATAIDNTAAEAWTLDPDSAIRIGTTFEPAATALHRPASPWLEGSRIWVANAQNEIRVFDTDGTLVRTIGRAGQGPGEFRYLTRLRRLAGGRIVTWEGYRVQLLDSLGHALAVYRPGLSVEMNARTAFTDDGRFVALERATPLSAPKTRPPRARAWRPIVAVAVFDSVDGEPLVVDRIPGVSWWVRDSKARGLPLGADPAVAAGAGIIAYTSGIEYEVTVTDTHGRRLRVLRLAVSPPRATQQTLHDWDEDYLRGLREAGMHAGSSARPSDWEFELPERVPAWQRLIIDDRGCIWAQRYRLPLTDSMTWDVLDPSSGRAVAFLPVERRLALWQVTGGRVVGIEEDSLGVRRILVRRLRTAAPYPDCSLR